MSFLFPTSPAAAGAVDAPWMHQPITYLIIAAICPSDRPATALDRTEDSLVVALRFLKRALAPIGALIQAVAAAALVAFTLALALALAMLIIAAAATVR